MPRKCELTWQAGSATRQGRWKKKYKGRTIYLSSARCKSDVAGYQQALAIWQQKKQEIDAEEAARPKANQAEYEAAIGEWEQVLRWCLEHGDEATVNAAREKLASLQAGLDQKLPPPIRESDRFLSRFAWPQPILDEIGALVGGAAPAIADRTDCDHANPRIVSPSEKATIWLDGSPSRIQMEIWRDRLDAQNTENTPKEETLGEYIERYLAEELLRVRAGDLSSGRYVSKQNNLARFRDWIGAGTSLTAITGKILLDFRGDLLNKIAQNALAPDTAHGRLGDVLAFVRWLWQIEALPELPRILAEKSQKLAIGKKLRSPQVFTVDEVKSSLEKASERTRLYLLLMLNCGMYQGDIANLKPDEVDFRAGTLTRKRSKTKAHASVPVVCYRLWSETLVLLQKHRQLSGDRLLLNSNGNPLVTREVTSDGKPRTNDTVKNAYDRLKTKTGIQKPLKLLRKTSANLIRSNEKYRGLENLFLGLSPREISDRHYTQPPELLLAEATKWLGEQYGIK